MHSFYRAPDTLQEGRMDRHDEILRIDDHRPWPLPDAPWAMRQTWADLLFAHWPVDADALRAAVPAPLTLETFEGRAWVGVVPFAIRDLGVRSLPGLPTATDFLELNVRTYVSCGGRSGVYFFTLDASSALAVAGARTAFGLPYHHADMSMSHAEGWIRYRSDRDNGARSFNGRYRPVGEAFTAQPGTLDHFLTERYALMNVVADKVSHVDIHHVPWPLQRAEAEIDVCTIAHAAGIRLPDIPPVLHYAAEQHIVNWLLTPGCPDGETQRD
jgi:uncharacterized protein